MAKPTHVSTRSAWAYPVVVHTNLHISLDGTRSVNQDVGIDATTGGDREVTPEEGRSYVSRGERWIVLANSEMRVGVWRG